MKLPTIDGRECVPVRLMPFLTRWQRLTPDDIARTFSWRHPFGKVRWWSKGMYQLLSDGTYSELQPRDWDAAADKLATLETTLSKQEEIEGESDAEWERRSVELLPAAVFVWRDDLESEYVRLFGKSVFFVEQPGLPELSDETYKLALNNAVETGNFDSFSDTSMARLMTRPGDGQLSFDPLLDVQSRRVIFEGFESLIVETKATNPRQGGANPAQVVGQSLADDGGHYASVWAREKDTLLKIIWGIARSKPYNFDPDAARSDVPPTIATATAAAGVAVSDDTIRKWLKEAASRYVSTNRSNKPNSVSD